MLYVKDHKTQYMFDPFDHLGPKRKKLLKESWAKVFRDSVLPYLPVELLAKYYDPTQGRPTNELFSVMGAMVLQQMHDLNDDDTAAQFTFNIQWHYALDITNGSDSNAYVCLKSLWSMRHIMTENNLYLPLFEEASKKIAQDFNVDTDKQRIDSVHICSNMRHLDRIGLFVKTIKKFLTNLKRHHKNLFTKLGKEFINRYLTKQGEGTFSMVKPSQSANTLESLANDLFFLVERFTSNSRVVDMTSYQLLVRLLKEQCIVEQSESADPPKVSIKTNKDVRSDSLQNPSDPDAGYSGHKGQGYQVQVMETYSTDEDSNQLSLILLPMLKLSWPMRVMLMRLFLPLSQLSNATLVLKRCWPTLYTVVMITMKKLKAQGLRLSLQPWGHPVAPRFPLKILPLRKPERCVAARSIEAKKTVASGIMIKQHASPKEKLMN